MPDTSASESYRRIEGDARLGLILLADHARNTIPAEYHGLGMAPAEMQRHIAYDIGVEGVTEGLATRLGLPALLTCFSRLLIDPNRGADDPTLIMRISDGAIVPGNARVDDAERARRIARFHKPYHDAVAREIDACLAAGVVPALVAIHSFTPFWRGVPRPWHAGILWDRDPRFSNMFIEGLSAAGDIIVGDNEPYTGTLEGDTLNIHGSKRGLAHVLVEIRQDLIGGQSGVDEWVERLARILEPAMKDPALHRAEVW
ncbi:N-formylglutamate amidohydrolase [soil metagenome]